MPTHRILCLVATGVAGLMLYLVGASLSREAVAETQLVRTDARVLSAKMLTGTVRSASGKALEGVVISARGSDKTFTTSIFTDEQGAYIFPPMEEGQYRVWAQAVGYRAGRAEVSLNPNKAIKHDFTLKTIKDFSRQLSGAEWMAALPEDTPANRRLKAIFENSCTGCHVPNFVLQNRFDEAGWRKILATMAQTGEARDNAGGLQKESHPIIDHFKDELAAYLAKMRGPGPSPMKFHLLPRPKGEAARVVITEYDIPPVQINSKSHTDELAWHDGSDWSEGTPGDRFSLGVHDVTTDFLGNAWITSSAQLGDVRSYAKVDTKTGKVTNFIIPGEDGYARSSHAITTSSDGIIWFNLRPRSLARLDPRTETLDIFNPPESMIGCAGGGHVEVDGKEKVWCGTEIGALCFDPVTREFTEFDSVTPGIDKRINPHDNEAVYGIAADADGNGWWAEIGEDSLGFSDIETGKSGAVRLRPSEMVEVLTDQDRKYYAGVYADKPENRLARSDRTNINAPGAVSPRRMGGDHTGSVIWAAEWWGQKLAKVDIHTHQVSYYPIPIPNANIYDVDVFEKDHSVWATLRNGDRAAKFDPKAGKWTVYMLPTLGAEARNINVDQVTGDVWLAYYRTSKAARLQFRTEKELRTLKAQLQ